MWTFVLAMWTMDMERYREHTGIPWVKLHWTDILLLPSFKFYDTLSNICFSCITCMQAILAVQVLFLAVSVSVCVGLSVHEL